MERQGPPQATLTANAGFTDSTTTPHRNRDTPHAVDNTDWLKTAAIVLVVVDHIGFFFIREAHWWHAFGRLAAPIFFFLMGYANTRTIPFRWIWLGVVLTLLSSWNANWTWVAPNILLSFALIRVARPYVEIFAHKYGWVAFVVLVSALVLATSVTDKVVDYGATGWLWALFGLYQRRYVDGRSEAGVAGAVQNPDQPGYVRADNAVLARVLACMVAAIVYVLQEQKEFSLPQLQLAVFILGAGAMSVVLCFFMRGPSGIQPPAAVARALRFIGRHTLEIYAIHLAGFELIVKLAPDFAP